MEWANIETDGVLDADEKSVEAAICPLSVNVTILGVNLPVPLVDSLGEAVEAPADVHDFFADAIEIESAELCDANVCQLKESK